MPLTRLNFAATGVTTRGRRLLVLCFGVLALPISGAHWFFQYEANAALDARLHKPLPRASAKPVMPAAQQKELQEQLKVVKTAVQQLNVPILELIKALPPPQDIRVALLGLDVASHQGVNAGTAPIGAGLLKVTAEAKTAQEMASYVSFLAKQPLFQSVYLVKHELQAASPETPYRFLLEAQWQK